MEAVSTAGPKSTPPAPRPEPRPERHEQAQRAHRAEQAERIAARESSELRVPQQQSVSPEQVQPVESVHSPTTPVTQQARDPVLVVRSGPAPPPELSSDVERVIREALEERATLRRVHEVLDQPAAQPEPTVILPGTSEGQADQELRLPGQDRSGPPEQERPVTVQAGASRMVSTAPPPGQQAAETQVGQEIAERQEHQQDIAPTTQRDNAVRTSTVAATSGAVQNPDEPRKVDPPGERSEAQTTAAVAEEAFTQAGAVEAKTENEVVSRFLLGQEREDPGPEPRPSEHLGNRSEPFSTFA